MSPTTKARPRRLSWRTIARRFPRQWVVVAAVEWPSGTKEPRSGIVHAHAELVDELMPTRSRMTGAVILWTGVPVKLLPYLRGKRPKDVLCIGRKPGAIASAAGAPESCSRESQPGPTGTTATETSLESSPAGRIVSSPNIWGGKPVVRTRRLAVEHVLAYLAHGATVAELLVGFPGLEKEDVLACVDFAFRAVRDKHGPAGKVLL